MDVVNRVQMADISINSLTRYPNIAQASSKDDSTMAECDRNLMYLDMSVANVPQAIPSSIDTMLSSKNLPSASKGV